MAGLISLREGVRNIYRKYSVVILPVFKAFLSFFILYFLSTIFGYNAMVNHIYVLAVLSAMQAFLPISFTYYTSTALVALNLWSVSPEIMLVFLAVAVISRLSVLFDDSKYCILTFLVPVVFFLRLEFLIPVLVGIICGFGGIFPVTGGILIYYIGVCTREVNTLLETAAGSGTGAGLQRLVQLFTADKQMLVILVVFDLVIFLTAVLYRIFHERAWQLAAIIGNVALALLLLSARMFFDLDYPIYQILLECFLAVLAAAFYQLFRGLGDLGRTEKVVFEDDEYIYYVKAVPKFQLSATQRNVTRIKPERGQGPRERRRSNPPE